MTMSSRPRYVLHALIALGAGLAAGFLWPWPLTPILRFVCGFDVGALVYLVVVWHHLLGAGEAISQAADEEDSGHLILTAVVIISALAGMCAVIALGMANQSPLHLVLAGLTIVLCWLLLQTIFAAHYASLYRAGVADDADRAGLEFPGGGPIRFLDFLYFAFTVGLTFQVSDVTTNTPAMRRIVMVHALIAFAFNTAIIAIAVGVSTSLLQMASGR